MSRLARLSLANRSVIALATLVVIAFGWIATGTLKQEMLPPIEAPIVNVTATYPGGASPAVVEREVTEPIEQAIEGVEGRELMTSTTTAGAANVTMQLEYGTDVDDAAQEMQQAIGRIQGLPEDVDPEVSTRNFDDFPVIVLAASADMSQRKLADALETSAIPELSAIDGVSSAEVTGVRDRHIKISIDLDDVEDEGLTESAVRGALQANGVIMPGGEITDDGKTLTIDSGRTFSSIDDIRNMYISPAGGGGQSAQGQGQGPPQQTPAGLPGAQSGSEEKVKLSKVADVRLEDAEASALTRTNGTPTLGILVNKEQDASTVAVSRAVKEKLSAIKDDIGSRSEMTVSFDQAPYIEESLEALTTEGALGLGFAVLIILVFLMSIRSTVVTAISIPLSLLIALIGLYAWDYSLNIFTLAALTIAVGRVVDDSIVVLENIKRHLGYGERKHEAIIQAVKEVAGAVTSATITTVAVFLPIAFVGDEVGELFRPFSLTVTIALLASLVVSLTIIPVLAYWFMKRPEGDPEKIREEAERKERRSILQRIYVPIIRFATRFKLVTVLMGVAILAGTVVMLPGLKTGFLEDSGGDAFVVQQELPPGTSLEKTDSAAKKVEKVLAGMRPEVQSYQTTVGGGGPNPFAGGGSNRATFQIAVELPEGKKGAMFEAELGDAIKSVDGVGEIKVFSAQAGPGGGNELAVDVEAPTEKSLKAASDKVVAAMSDIDGVREVSSDLSTAEPGITVKPKRGEAAEKGFTDAALAQAVRDAMNGSKSEVIVGDEKMDMVVASIPAPDSLKKLRDLKVVAPATGKEIKLSKVAVVKEEKRATRISRIDGERSAKVTAKPVDGANLGAINTRLDQKINGTPQPDGTRTGALELPDGAKASIGGVSQQQEESFGQLGLALLAAIALVFAVMVGTFRSLVQPLILLVSIPFAATGALGLLRLTDTTLDVAAVIGMLMLVGIVVTNAIVLIDLINQYRAQGMGIREAVIEGGRHRLRPILMTAAATICALTPMAMGITGGGIFISGPLAIVVIGGLISSTLLTLVLVPTLYTAVERFKERVRNRRDRRRERKARAEEGKELQPVG